MTKFSQCIAACAALVSASAVFAHTDQHAAGHPIQAPQAASSTHAAHGTPRAADGQQAWGKAGQAAAVTRTIELRMGDDMRFAPSQFNVKLGETVRIRVANTGQILHEIVLGTADSLNAHAQAMLQHPGMAHGEAFMAHVPPQHNGELIWTFNRPGTFDFACLVAGHYQAGMRGTFTVSE